MIRRVHKDHPLLFLLVFGASPLELLAAVSADVTPPSVQSPRVQQAPSLHELLGSPLLRRSLWLSLRDRP